MKEEYESLSGEKIDISTLSESEQEHLSEIEKLIENSADFFEVERKALAPLIEGKLFTAQSLTELHHSPRYKVMLDLVTRYWQKLYSRS